MNDNTKTWRSSTTTRSWSSTTDLTPEQRVNIEELLDGKLDGVDVSQSWSYAGVENGEAFKVEIKNGAVTVNGRKYDSLDEVPRAERERIEALRSGQGMGMDGLWDMLKNAGVDMKDLAPEATAANSKPVFTIETDSPESASRETSRAHTQAMPQAAAAHDATLPPGAVPAGGGLRRALLIGIVIGLALWVAQALNVF